MQTARVSSIRYLVAALALIPMTAATAKAAPAAEPIAVHAAAVDAPPSLEELTEERNRANALTMTGRWSEARRQWARVARMHRARGELPIEAAWAQAQLTYGAGNASGAATILKQLGEEAREAGSADVSARALVEAAVLFQSVEMQNEARECMEQVEILLQGSSLDAGQRALVESRIIR